MDDFVLNVRQIAQYESTAIGPNDLLLVQQGGLGGPYVSATAADVVIGGLNNGPGILSIGNLQLPDDGAIFWGHGIILFEQLSGLQFNYVVNGQSINYLTLTPNGDMSLPQGTLTVARSPINDNDVATKKWTELNSVSSWNGRTGQVVLTLNDINSAMHLDPGDTAASQAWVNQTICNSLNQWASITPLVFTFNGRVGDITLTVDDVEAAFFAPGAMPTAPTPPLGNSSDRIATTRFVDDSLADATQTIIYQFTGDLEQLENLLQTTYAPIDSPSFTGHPTAPMPPAASNDATIATTAFVISKMEESTTGVASFNTRTGAVTFTPQDLSDVGGATLASPAFTGNPTAPTPPVGDQSTSIATTAWVLGEIGAIGAGVTTWNGRAGAVQLTLNDITTAGGAPLASPALTGAPTAPTPGASSNDTSIATTAWATQYTVKSFNGRSGAVSLQLNDITAAGGAPLASPAFTGTPTAPTAAPSTNNTQIATTAFVQAAVSGGGAVSSFNGRTGAVTLTAADVTGAGGALAVQVIPECGRLQLGAASPSATLQFAPYKGNQIKINGAVRTFATVSATNNNATINGVTGQTLGPSVLYYVYAYWTGSAVAIDFSTAGHTTSTTAGNEGTEIKTGDDTRSLIGLIRTGGTGLFVDDSGNRFTRSWFNRVSQQLVSGYINHGLTTLNAFIVMTNGNFNFVQFADEGLMVGWPAKVQATAQANAYTAIQIDGSQIGDTSLCTVSAAWNSVAPVYHNPATGEGYHQVVAVAQTNAATTTFLGYMSGRLVAS